jgi:S-adenosylmethionine synthetase
MTRPASERLFTSESVTSGHPDKVCDQISDAILDAILAGDPTARVAVEALITRGQVHVAGEVSTTDYADVAELVRGILLGIGYDAAHKGIDGGACGVSVSIEEQSADIAHGVDRSYEARHAAADPLDAQGAGDQGLMFGYACDETPELMPLPIHAAHRLALRLEEVRRSGAVPDLRPDGKTQVTVRYRGFRPIAVETVVVSAQHAPRWTEEALAAALAEEVIRPVLAELPVACDGPTVLVNPAGPFVAGGPQADTGLTGRKIIVDTYGGMARHGGGAFSGKDPSKVDRSAAYAMRWVAKNVVAAGLARRCEVQVAYAIGAAHPVGLYVDTFGTGAVEDSALARAVREVFDLRPAALVAQLDLLRPIYRATAAYGHFGRELPEFTWERADRVAQLRAALGE